jgi:hypothetical protein
MKSVYHIVAIHVNETFWAHIWRLRSRYLGTGCDSWPLGVPELEIRERGTFGARPSGRAVNGCKNLGTNAERVVGTHFTLTQVGYFC